MGQEIMGIDQCFGFDFIAGALPETILCGTITRLHLLSFRCRWSHTGVISRWDCLDGHFCDGCSLFFLKNEIGRVCLKKKVK